MPRWRNLVFLVCFKMWTKNTVVWFARISCFNTRGLFGAIVRRFTHSCWEIRTCICFTRSSFILNWSWVPILSSWSTFQRWSFTVNSYCFEVITYQISRFIFLNFFTFNFNQIWILFQKHFFERDLFNSVAGCANV